MKFSITILDGNVVKPVFPIYFRPVPGKGNGNVSDIKVCHCFLFHKSYNLFTNRVDKPPNIVLTFSISTPDPVYWWLDLARLGAREPTNWQWVKSKKIVSEKDSKQAKRKQVNKQKGSRPLKYILAVGIFTKDLERSSILKFSETEIKWRFPFRWYYMTLFFGWYCIWHCWLMLYMTLFFGWCCIWHYFAHPAQIIFVAGVKRAGVMFRHCLGQ